MGKDVDIAREQNFIVDFFTEVQRAEADPLVKREILGHFEKLGLDELLRIKKEIGTKTKQSGEPNPKHVADFMSLFNKREGLKYLTHDFDENSSFEIDSFLIKAKGVFDEFTSKLDLPQSLWRIIKQFAFDSQQTTWTSLSEDYTKPKKINIGWASRELRDWSKKNNLHPIKREEYKEIVNDFRRITRIESPNLERLIDMILEEEMGDELKKWEISKIDLSKADFYTHVQFLKDALSVIIVEIKKHSNEDIKKKITLKYERGISEDGYYLRKLKIVHHNSYPNKELGLLIQEWGEKGNMGNIQSNLKGYCHWSIETLIEGVPKKVNILKDTNISQVEKLDDYPEGFIHELTFYYK
jgi:hypothetical protein